MVLHFGGLESRKRERDTEINDPSLFTREVGGNPMTRLVSLFGSLLPSTTVFPTGDGEGRDAGDRKGRRSVRPGVGFVRFRGTGRCSGPKQRGHPLYERPRVPRGDSWWTRRAGGRIGPGRPCPWGRKVGRPITIPHSQPSVDSPDTSQTPPSLRSDGEIPGTNRVLEDSGTGPI